MNIRKSLLVLASTLLPLVLPKSKLRNSTSARMAMTPIAGQNRLPCARSSERRNWRNPGTKSRSTKVCIASGSTHPGAAPPEKERVVYQAARGETVEIRGSEIVKNWVRVQEDIWKATVPNSLFGDFNPYTNLIRGDWFEPKGRPHHTGAVYLNGEWRIEAAKLEEVLRTGESPSWLTDTDPQVPAEPCVAAAHRDAIPTQI